jgi:hypothetical protein
MNEGPHAIDVKSPEARPFAERFTIVGKETVTLAVKLVPLDTPARLRIESSVDSSAVAIDGTPRGEAPLEVSLPPGPHRVRVTSESYAPQASEVALRPGERTVVRVGMVPAHAPIGLRIAPAFLALLPLRTDTPFGSFESALGLSLFHDAVRLRNLRFGLDLAYRPQALNSVGIGAVGTWCPDAFASATRSWCPATATLHYVFGDRSGAFVSGEAAARVTTALELRRRSAFVRIAAGVAAEDYGREVATASGSTSKTVLVLWSTVLELAIGLDL